MFCGLDYDLIQRKFHVHLKAVYFAVWELSCWYLLSQACLICHLKPLFPYPYTVRIIYWCMWLLNSPAIVILLSVFFLYIVKVCCIYFNIPVLGTSEFMNAIFCFLIDLFITIWCWEGLGTGGKGDDRGWDGWMASLTQWMWVWVNSGRWWWTGKPGVLRFMGPQRVGHDWETEVNWTDIMPLFAFLIDFVLKSNLPDVNVVAKLFKNFHLYGISFSILSLLSVLCI